MARISAMARISVGQFNVLCPAYALRWGEREGCVDHTAPQARRVCNWRQRWPALRRVLTSARWDVLTLQELQEATLPDVSSALSSCGMRLCYHKHPARFDGLGVAYRSDVFEELSNDALPFSGYTVTARVDLRHRETGKVCRVFSTHQRGAVEAQMTQLLDDVSIDEDKADVLVLAGDFNEDFGRASGGVQGSRVAASGFVTLCRAADEPEFSRPPHKQDAEQTSGKGKVDWIWVKSRNRVELSREGDVKRALTDSHQNCPETGHWPSDHGLESVTLCELDE
eukprot:TRINITY_DN15397_c0_g1_i1.p1 TRINITY_DN15397_c0_g1~~TRINITY_DN15397_c0_g1_i1.p1  ORF type:complete len:320 (+),score=96.93 TRINITY_DN15397_c0_g1_i1:115-960(+)